MISHLKHPGTHSQINTVIWLWPKGSGTNNIWSSAGVDDREHKWKPDEYLDPSAGCIFSGSRTDICFLYIYIKCHHLGSNASIYTLYKHWTCPSMRKGKSAINYVHSNNSHWDWLHRVKTRSCKKNKTKKRQSLSFKRPGYRSWCRLLCESGWECSSMPGLVWCLWATSLW